MWRATATLLTAVLVIAGSSPATGQIPGNWPVIAATGPMECGDAPAICQGASHIANAPASFDAFVYIELGGDEIQECALGVTWPADWSVAAELCAGLIVEGALDNLDNGIRVVFTPCVPGNTAFLHLRVQAPSIGRMKLVPGLDGAFGVRHCQETLKSTSARTGGPMSTWEMSAGAARWGIPATTARSTGAGMGHRPASTRHHGR